MSSRSLPLSIRFAPHSELIVKMSVTGVSCHSTPREGRQAAQILELVPLVGRSIGTLSGLYQHLRGLKPYQK